MTEPTSEAPVVVQPVVVQVTAVLRRARNLPAGPARNELRQLARALLKMHRAGLCADVQIFEPAMLH